MQNINGIAGCCFLYLSDHVSVVVGPLTVSVVPKGPGLDSFFPQAT